ncbi:MAG TPA: 30S ribosomal protein S8 [Oligoflexia bacterium]|nr:30S ribosomal protein S8 [Oligoflexia bacterium]
MITDQIADLLTRIRNAQGAGHPAVAIPASKTKERILNLLCEEGYVAKVEAAQDLAGKPQLKAFLKYNPRGEPVIKELRRISRPGRRIYVGKDEIPLNRGGLGIVIVSTSKGMLSDQAARKAGLGGELVCSVF